MLEGLLSNQFLFFYVTQYGWFKYFFYLLSFTFITFIIKIADKRSPSINQKS